MANCKKFEVKTYKVYAYCPECGGFMSPDLGGKILLSNPPKWPHKCLICGYQENLTEVYPKTEYEEI